MRYGSPIGGGYGEPRNAFLWSYPDMIMAAKVGYTYIPWHFRLRAGWGNAFIAIWVNDSKYATRYVSEDTDLVVNIAPPPGGGSLNLCAIRIGQLSDPSWDNPLIPQAFDILSPKVTLNWTWQPQLIQPALQGGTYLNTWVLTGHLWGHTCAPVQGHPTWGRMTFTVYVVGGVATVTVYYGAVVVASGSGAVNTTITLTGILTGSVAVAAGAINVLDGILDVRWPVSMQIKRGLSSPPGTLVATVACNNVVLGTWAEPDDLSPAIYYYQGQEISDTGEAGTTTSIVPETIISVPQPPLNLTYISGDAAATLLHFLNSQTSGATYNVYCNGAIGVPPDFSTPQQTLIAGTSGASHSLTLPAVTNYPGFLPVIVRAVSGGVEEQNDSVLLIEYDASGNVVVGRPNTPYVSTFQINSGRNLVVQGLYNSSNEKSVATALRLYFRTPTGSYGSYAAQTTLAALQNTLKSAQLLWMFSGDGYYYVKLQAVDANGVEDANGSPEILVDASEAQMPAPSDFSGIVARA